MEEYVTIWPININIWIYKVHCTHGCYICSSYFLFRYLKDFRRSYEFPSFSSAADRHLADGLQSDRCTIGRLVRDDSSMSCSSVMSSISNGSVTSQVWLPSTLQHNDIAHCRAGCGGLFTTLAPCHATLFRR